jgi:hypothetical protein
MTGPASTNDAGTECVDCGAPPTSPDVIYRFRDPFFGGKLVSLCDRHAWDRVTPGYEWLPPSPCVWCRRSVVRSKSGFRGQTYCSAACASRARRARQSEARKSLRRVAPRPCEGCGDMFEPSRANQFTHSNACRVATQRNKKWLSESSKPAWCERCGIVTDPNEKTGQCNFCDSQIALPAPQARVAA